MLQFITGRSGSGKTAELYRQMHRLVTKNEQIKVFLLVPEQTSYEHERRLLSEFGPILSQRVQVISFTRMAELVFREIGGVAGKRMDETISLLLMSQALLGITDSLNIYRRHATNADYIRTVLATVAECKQGGISPELLKQTADSLPNGILRTKTEELSLIYNAYDALIAQSHLIDPQNDLTVLANRIPESRLFDGAFLFLDDFKGFTRQEQTVLEVLMTRTDTMTVSLCADNLSLPSDTPLDRFSSAVRTANRLKEAAFSHHIPVGKALRLSENHRTTDLALLALEAGCYVCDAPSYEEATDSVAVISCQDIAEECRFTARTIRRLLRENGGFARDFTVVAGDINSYVGLLDRELSKEGVPYVLDRRDPILTTPLIAFLEAALAAVNGGDSDAILRMLKTGLAGFSTSAISQLENYIFLWNIRGKQWFFPFENSPEGLTAKANRNSASKLDYLNLLRRRIIVPLERFRTRLSGQNSGTEFSTAILRLLIELRVPRLVRMQCARLERQQEYALAEREKRLWDYLMNLLDKFSVALSNTRLSLSRLADLFHLAVTNDDLGSLPGGLDGVHLGSANRIRYTSPKTLILLGANEGVFPAYPVAGGMLTDRERKALITAGLPLADDADWQSAEQRYYAYMALSAPSKRLIITYIRNGDGEAFQPSSLVGTVRRLLPHCQDIELSDDQAALPESADDAFSRLASRWHQQTAETAALKEVFRHHPTFRNRLILLEKNSTAFAFRDPAAARRLFGDDLNLSPSQVEQYYKCRFAYFCQYGLRIRARRKAELDALEAGTLIHYIMQTLLPRYMEAGADTCRKDTVMTDTTAAVLAYVRDFMGGTDNKDERFCSMAEQLAHLCGNLLWRVIRELAQSRFTPVDYELPIGMPDGEGIPAWTLTEPDGSRIRIRGKVDRVDIYRQNGHAYIRIIDYKTGTKSFSLSEVTEGINLQMLIYIFSICQNGQKRYGDVLPAGVLYLPAKLPVIQVSRSLSENERERERLKTMRMDGLLLDDPEILNAMETDIAGIFIPASRTKSGAISKSSNLATLAQFGYLRQHIQKLLIRMSAELHRGDISPLPASGLVDACRYCDYYDICGHEFNDPSHQILSTDRETVLRQLAEDNGEVISE